MQLAPARNINSGKHQSLVHGKVLGGKARDTALLTHSLGKRLTKNNSHIFYRMMGVYFDIAFGLNIQIEQAMTAECIKHVVKKGNASKNTWFSSGEPTETRRQFSRY